jgi:inositol transport system substrate-binding protein
MVKLKGRLLALAATSVVVLAACSGAGTTTAPESAAPAESGAPAESAAPAGSAATGEAVKICVTFPILDQFLQTVADGMEAKATELGNVELNIVAAQEKTDVQLGQVENCISQGVDAIVVIPVDTDAAGPMTEAATAAGIPLVYVNRRPSDLPTDGSIPYVGSDSLYAGTVEMQELAKLAEGKGNVVILIGDPANEAAVLRTKGCKDVVAENPDMKVTKEQSGNWYREEGLSIMENWLQTGEQIDVVCANNDEMALGAIQALKNANKLDSVIVGGVDATKDALAAMEAGELEVTVFQDAQGQGGGGIEAAVKLANGETVETDQGIVDIPYQLVTPANMADFQ